MNRRAFIKSGGVALVSVFFADTHARAAEKPPVDRSQLSSVLCAAFHSYLNNSRAYSDLYARYLGVAPKFVPQCDQGSWVKVASGGMLDSILKHGVLRFGYAEAPPYVYHAGNGKLAGIDWELGNELTSIIRAHYIDSAQAKGLRAEWIPVAVQFKGDPEQDKFNALFEGLKKELFDIAMSGQANISTAAKPLPATAEVDWSCPTEILFTNILYSGLGDLHDRMRKLVGASRDAFIAEVKSWATDALFICVSNEGPSTTNAEMLVKDIGARAKLSKGNVKEITDAINNQKIHFAIGDAVAYSWMAVQSGFKGLNMNIAAATDALGTAQPVAAFSLRSAAK